MPEGLRWGQDGPGVLLVHGFTGRPDDLAAFGESQRYAGSLVRSGAWVLHSAK